MQSNLDIPQHVAEGIGVIFECRSLSERQMLTATNSAQLEGRLFSFNRILNQMILLYL